MSPVTITESYLLITASLILLGFLLFAIYLYRRKHLPEQAKVDENKFFKSPELNESEVAKSLAKLETDVIILKNLVDMFRQLVYMIYGAVVLGLVGAIINNILFN